MSDNLPTNVIEIIDLSDDDDDDDEVVFVETRSPPPPPATESIVSTPTGLKYHLECGCPRCMDRKLWLDETIAVNNSTQPPQQQQPQVSDAAVAAVSSASLPVSGSASDNEYQNGNQPVANGDKVNEAAEALVQLQLHFVQHNSATTEQFDHSSSTGTAQQQQLQQQQHQQQGSTENPVPDSTLPAQQQQQQNQDDGGESSSAGNERTGHDGTVQNEDVEMVDDDQSPDMIYHRRLSAALSAAVSALDTSSSSTELVNSVNSGQPAVSGSVPWCGNDGTNVVPLWSTGELNCVVHLVQHCQSRRRLGVKHKRARQIRRSHLDLTKRGHRVHTRMVKSRRHRCHYPGCLATFARKHYLMRHKRVHRPLASRVQSCRNDGSGTKSDHVSHLSNSTDHHHESLSSNAHVGSCHLNATNDGDRNGPEDLASGSINLDCADTTDTLQPATESIVTTPEGLRYHRDCGCPRCISIIRSAI